MITTVFRLFLGFSLFVLLFSSFSSTFLVSLSNLSFLPDALSYGISLITSYFTETTWTLFAYQCYFGITYISYKIGYKFFTDFF